jgi:hypothetical protein
MLEPRGRLSLLSCSSILLCTHVCDLYVRRDALGSSLLCMSLENGKSETCAARRKDCGRERGKRAS